MRLVLALLVLPLLAGCATPAPGASTQLLEDATAPADPYDPGWPDPGDALVRPGTKAGVLTDPAFGHFCTVDFIFSSPDNRTLYAGISSHCVTGWSLGDPVPLGEGEVVTTIAYCSYGTLDGVEECTDNTADNDERDWNDFALLRIEDDDHAKVHPAMLKYGGPTGVSPPRKAGDKVLTYGNTDARDGGLPLPDVLDGRSGVVTSRTGWITEVLLEGPALPGDSGSPVLAADGGAVGVMKYLSAGTNGVTNLDAALAFLHENTELRVELKTWPLEGGALPLAGSEAGPTGPADHAQPAAPLALADGRAQAARR